MAVLSQDLLPNCVWFFCLGVCGEGIPEVLTTFNHWWRTGTKWSF